MRSLIKLFRRAWLWMLIGAAWGICGIFIAIIPEFSRTASETGLIKFLAIVNPIFIVLYIADAISIRAISYLMALLLTSSAIIGAFEALLLFSLVQVIKRRKYDEESVPDEKRSSTERVNWNKSLIIASSLWFGISELLLILLGLFKPELFAGFSAFMFIFPQIVGSLMVTGIFSVLNLNINETELITVLAIFPSALIAFIEAKIAMSIIYPIVQRIRRKK